MTEGKREREREIDRERKREIEREREGTKMWRWKRYEDMKKKNAKNNADMKIWRYENERI